MCMCVCVQLVRERKKDNFLNYAFDKETLKTLKLARISISTRFDCPTVNA